METRSIGSDRGYGKSSGTHFLYLHPRPLINVKNISKKIIRHLE
ncbi:MAG: hypothetical protein U5L72_18540 [Bacteroidales bacterium]|nr:hypothetical protein [Bacteroidales bacterium]